MKHLRFDNCHFILIDFEFRSKDGIEGNPIEVHCMVSFDLKTKKYKRLWADELATMPSHPFPETPNTVLVAYFASAEIKCFKALGWDWQGQILDLYVEFRTHTNGMTLPHGKSLLGAMQFFNLETIEAQHKDAMRDIALRGGPFSAQERSELIEYCQSDVDALNKLLEVIKSSIDLPRALLRGMYTEPLAAMEDLGSPIDYETFQDLSRHWESIKIKLIEKIDQGYGVYEYGTFKESLFRQYLDREKIRWPFSPNGKLKLDEDTFKVMANLHPQIKPLRMLRDSLAKLRLNSLQVGVDGRNRCLLSPFSSITGRNQPSTTKFVFGLARWARGLIQPKPGMAIAYIDWSQQEFAIAAALSGDENMKEAYRSGDPYLAFAKQAGAVPGDATKHSHPNERDQYKQCVLATQYGMGASALAARLKQPELGARQLLAKHRQVYRRFWDWSDNLYNHSISGNKIHTSLGWCLNVPSELNPRSLRNFPMQATAAEMLRIACIRMRLAGINLCAPVHDAVLIEAPEDQIEGAIEVAQECMVQASKDLLDGFALTSDADIFIYPRRFLDEGSQSFWDEVMAILAEVKKTPPKS
jgi:DNA polymerase-1